MASITVDKSFVILLIVNCYFLNIISARDYKKEGFEGDAYNAMWFGPRLGKRSMSLSSENDRQGFYRMLEEADALKYFYNQLPYYDQADDPNVRAVTKKVIFTPKLGRSADEDNYRKIDNVNFTPRLGRRLPEKVGVTLSDSDILNEEPQQMNSGQKNRYFSPRLGRTMTFSPRLGRDILYDVIPEANIRVVRSTEKKNDTKKS